ncbi:T9SS type A sorting domain-containing protein, partial [Vibrio parahaemolyticus]
LHEENEKNEIDISPNPSQNYVKVTMPIGLQHNGLLNITDITGRTLKQIKLKSTDQNIYTFDLSSFSDGLYIVSITENEIRQSKP